MTFVQEWPERMHSHARGAVRQTGRRHHAGLFHHPPPPSPLPPTSQANRQCCEDNPDALNHHELLLPGHLLLKFVKEQLENNLDMAVGQVRRRVGRRALRLLAAVVLRWGVG